MLRPLLGLVVAAIALPMPLAAETLGPVTDDLGVVEVAKGDPIVLGHWGSMSGPDSTDGIDERRGVEIAIADAGGSLLGFQLKLVSEDAQCTAEGGQLAASKLAGDKRILVALGPSCSSGARVGAPILWNAGIAAVGIGASAPALTAADRPPGFAGYLRVVPNDVKQAGFAANYAAEVKKYKTAATIHDGSPYTEQLVRAFEKAFEAAGGKVLAKEAVAPDTSDMRPVLTRIATTPPDVIFMPLFTAAAAFTVRQAKEVPTLKGTALLGAGSTFSPGMIDAAGDSVVGFYVVAAATDTFTDLYPAFVEKFKKEYGEAPTGGFSALGYDAGLTALKAIAAVAKTDADGNLYIGRKALRDALFATKKLHGMTGDINCDQYGDCGTQVYAVWEFTSGASGSFAAGTNPKKIFP
jgi:branched-chain amino acid transport system substrate-binding protein